MRARQANAFGPGETSHQNCVSEQDKSMWDQVVAKSQLLQDDAFHSEARLKRVLELRHAIESGTYHVDAEQVADALTRHVRQKA